MRKTFERLLLLSDCVECKIVELIDDMGLRNELMITHLLLAELSLTHNLHDKK